MEKKDPRSMTAWRSTPLKTVDDFLATLPDKPRAVLEDLRRTIREAAPAATEKISYHLPTFVYYGPLVAFSASTDHLSLHIMSVALTTTLKEELRPYHPTMATIHFTAARPLPSALVQKLVRARMKENEARAGK